MNKTLRVFSFAFLAVALLCFAGCSHDSTPAPVTMSITEFITALGDSVEEVTANKSAVSGVTLSADKKSANVWNVNLSGETDCSFPSTLVKADFRGLDTSGVTTMDLLFEGCTELTELNLSSFNTSNVTSMNSMFCNCSELKRLNLTSFDTSKVTDMEQMFYNCLELKELDVSSFDTSAVTDIDDIFMDCSSMAENPVVYYGPKWTKTDEISTAKYPEITFTQKA